MSLTAKPTQDLLRQTRQAAHPQCIVCGQASARGLGLRFAPCDGGGVEAVFECEERFQGYPNLLHGGVTSSLLDGAMTNCLFAHGILAVTAEMTVRFRHPVDLGSCVKVFARLTRSQAPLHVVVAELTQGGQVKAIATGKFMEMKPPAPSPAALRHEKDAAIRHAGVSPGITAAEAGPSMRLRMP